MTSQAQKGAAFRALHVGAPFVIPNPWDAGSANAGCLGVPRVGDHQLRAGVHEGTFGR